MKGDKLPAFVIRWLSYVPVAVLAALLVPSLLVQDGVVNFHWNNLYLWAALPAGFTAWKSRSMFLTVLVGMVVVAVMRLFL